MGTTSSSSSGGDAYTIEDWLFGRVNFEVPQCAVTSILAERGVDGSTPFDDAKEGTLDIRLLKADLYRWIVLGPSKVNSTSDSDNGWSHSGGGYSLSEYDKKLLTDEANAIYGELEPDSVFGKTRVRMRSLGIMRAYTDLDGTPIERKVR